jgi:hypothetical protein
LYGRAHQQLVGDLGELIDEAPAFRARRQVPQRLGPVLAVIVPSAISGARSCNSSQLMAGLQLIAQLVHRRPDARLDRPERRVLEVADLARRAPQIGREEQRSPLFCR